MKNRPKFDQKSIKKCTKKRSKIDPGGPWGPRWRDEIRAPIFNKCGLPEKIKFALADCARRFIKEKVGIWPRECARTIEDISRIRMDVARAFADEIWTKCDYERENAISIEKKLISDVKKSF